MNTYNKRDVTWIWILIIAYSNLILCGFGLKQLERRMLINVWDKIIPPSKIKLNEHYL